MEFYDVIEKRRTVRSFAEKAVPEEIIIKVLEAGVKAPTYNHLREWDFVLVKDMYVRLAIVKTEGIPDSFNMTKLEENFSNSDSLLKEMYLNAIPKQKSMLLKAPELLVVVYKPKTKVEESKRVYDLNCLAAAWCCIENILLALAEENLFGVTYIPQKTDQVKKVLNVPDQLEIAAIIPFGYKEDETQVIRQKQVNLKEKIHFNKW